jgi:hypothetical protein
MTDEEIAKLVPLINKLIDGIPTDIPIPGTGLHLDLAYAAMPVLKEHAFVTLPISLSIQSDDFPYLKDNTAKFPEFVESELAPQIEVIVSEYLIDNVLFLIHKERLVDLTTDPTQISITVS